MTAGPAATVTNQTRNKHLQNRMLLILLQSRQSAPIEARDQYRKQDMFPTSKVQDSVARPLYFLTPAYDAPRHYPHPLRPAAVVRPYLNLRCCRLTLIVKAVGAI